MGLLDAIIYYLLHKKSRYNVGMTIHHFTPDHFYNAFGSYEPVLTIASGDSVVTKTIDAGGTDDKGRKVAGSPNPQTGPFYVQDAMPGDALLVTIDQLTSNRNDGYTTNVVAAHVVDPEFVAKLPTRARITWQIDREKSLATAEGQSEMAYPLSPMLGCLGVAPAGRQCISSATSGPYGGNMDYRGLCAGVKVMFPVYEPGALLFVGDGHALQGDGEVVGTGIETSFDVQFTVLLLKGKKIYWPRGENADYIFTIGNVRPLEQAVQYATTEMLHWLQDDYGLSLVQASQLLGMYVTYDLGNIYDPAYTMVCKVPKKFLNRP